VGAEVDVALFQNIMPWTAFLLLLRFVEDAKIGGIAVEDVGLGIEVEPVGLGEGT